jgi:hypothetical protein
VVASFTVLGIDGVTGRRAGDGEWRAGKPGLWIPLLSLLSPVESLLPSFPVERKGHAETRRFEQQVTEEAEGAELDYSAISAFSC